VFDHPLSVPLEVEPTGAILHASVLASLEITRVAQLIVKLIGRLLQNEPNCSIAASTEMSQLY
jgi:hypothetical protein